jgi:hypothetical protein
MDWSVFTDEELLAIDKQQFDKLPDSKLKYFISQEEAAKTGKKAEPSTSFMDTVVRQGERALTSSARTIGNLVDKGIVALGGQSDNLAASLPDSQNEDKIREGESRVMMAERPWTSLGAGLAGSIADPINLIPGLNAAKYATGTRAVAKAAGVGAASGAGLGAIGGALQPVYEEYDDSIVKNILLGTGVGGALGGTVGALLGKYAVKNANKVQTMVDTGPPQAPDRLANYEPKPLVSPEQIDTLDAELKVKTDLEASQYPRQPFVDTVPPEQRGPQTAALLSEPPVGPKLPGEAPEPDSSVPALLRDTGEPSVPDSTKVLSEANNIIVARNPNVEEHPMRSAFAKAGFKEATPKLDEDHLLSRTQYGDDIGREDVFGNKIGGYSTKESAEMAMENKQLRDSHVIVEIDDGFVLRPVKEKTMVEVPAVKGQDPNKLLHTPTAETNTPVGTIAMTDPVEAKAAELGTKTGPELKDSADEVKTLAKELGKTEGETIRYTMAMRELTARAMRVGYKEVPDDIVGRFDLLMKFVKEGQIPDICPKG